MIINFFRFLKQQNTPSDPNSSLLSPQSGTSTKSLSSNLSSKSALSPTTPVLSPASKLVSSKAPSILSPTTPSGTNKSKRRRDRDARKNSQHYQESDILESYYRSSPGDKISDYEDIWNTTDQSNHSTWCPNERLIVPQPQLPLVSSTRIVDSQIERLKNSNDRLVTTNERVITPGEKCCNERLAPVNNDQLLPRNERLVIRNDKSVGNEKLSYKEVTSPEFTSFKPILEAKSPDSGSLEEAVIGKKPDLLSRVCKCIHIKYRGFYTFYTIISTTKNIKNILDYTNQFSHNVRNHPHKLQYFQSLKN